MAEQAATGAADGTTTGGTHVIAAAATVANGAGATGAGASGGDSGQSTQAAQWGDNWREQYAGENAARLNVLKRYTSPGAALDALFAARQKIDSGEVHQPLPANPTPEQIADYRTRNHIPEKPEGYLENLPKDVAIKDYNKDAVSDFAASMHKLNMPPAAVQEAIRWQNAWQDKQIEQRVEADNTLKTQVEDQLRADWGNDYRVNMSSIHALLGGAPEGVADAILQARGPDMAPLASNPDFVRFLAKIARDLNPVATIIPGASGANGMASVETRLGELNKMMGDRSSAYWKGPQADRFQKEYRDLLDAQLNLQKRSAA